MTVTRRSMPPRRAYTNMSVKAGVLAGSTYPVDEYKNQKTGAMVFDTRSGMPTAWIAAALEYGTRQRVARPFMHMTAADHKNEWVKQLRQLLKSGVSVRGAFAAVGQVMKEDIQHTISTWPGDNSTEWADIKGFNHGLLMTSHLLKSIDFETSEGAGTGSAA